MGSSKNPEQIMIALEPEAAAISCLEKKNERVQVGERNHHCGRVIVKAE